MSVCVVSSTQPASGERERDGGDVTEYPRAVESPAVIRTERRPDWLQSSLPSRPRRRRYTVRDSMSRSIT